MLPMEAIYEIVGRLTLENEAMRRQLAAQPFMDVELAPQPEPQEGTP